MSKLQGQVVEVSHIPLPSTAQHPDSVKLSFFDVFWLGLPPIQRLFLFNGTNNLSRPSIITSLKDSLHQTLSHYFLLAAKLVYLTDTGDAVFDCSSAAVGPGIAFYEAEANDSDIQQLIDDEVYDVEAFRQLVPELNVTTLPCSLFSVQVTSLGEEGLALGFSIHHSMVDGKAVWRFVEAWAACCRGAAQVPELLLVDRSLIEYPRVEEIARQFLREIAVPQQEV